MQKIKYHISTILFLLFSKTWDEPEAAGDVLFEHSVEEINNIFPSTQFTNGGNGTMVRIRRDWLRRMSTRFNERMQRYLEKE